MAICHSGLRLVIPTFARNLSLSPANGERFLAALGMTGGGNLSFLAAFGMTGGRQFVIPRGARNDDVKKRDCQPLAARLAINKL